MNRTQFIALNVIALVLTMLIVVNLVLARENRAMGDRIQQYQAAVTVGRQAEAILRQLTVRVAQGSDRDPELRKLLQRYDLKAVLTVDGKQKSYP
jgi:type II secretory pathway component PulJ